MFPASGNPEGALDVVMCWQIVTSTLSKLLIREPIPGSALGESVDKIRLGSLERRAQVGCRVSVADLETIRQSTPIGGPHDDASNGDGEARRAGRSGWEMVLVDLKIIVDGRGDVTLQEGIYADACQEGGQHGAEKDDNGAIGDFGVRGRTGRCVWWDLRHELGRWGFMKWFDATAGVCHGCSRLRFSAQAAGRHDCRSVSCHDATSPWTPRATAMHAARSRRRSCGQECSMNPGQAALRLKLFKFVTCQARSSP